METINNKKFYQQYQNFLTALIFSHQKSGFESGSHFIIIDSQQCYKFFFTLDVILKKLASAGISSSSTYASFQTDFFLRIKSENLFKPANVPYYTIAIKESSMSQQMPQQYL
jgi:hypothetical protein